MDIGVVGHTHGPLVESLVKLYLGVFLANVRDQASFFIVNNHVVGVKARPDNE